MKTVKRSECKCDARLQTVMHYVCVCIHVGMMQYVHGAALEKCKADISDKDANGSNTSLPRIRSKNFSFIIHDIFTSVQ